MDERRQTPDLDAAETAVRAILDQCWLDRSPADARAIAAAALAAARPSMEEALAELIALIEQVAPEYAESTVVASARVMIEAVAAPSSEAPPLASEQRDEGNLPPDDPK